VRSADPLGPGARSSLIGPGLDTDIGTGRGTGRLSGHRDGTRDWDGTSISSHCYFVPPWRPTMPLVGKRSPAGPGGDEKWICWW